jgi:hypothetical protein
MKSAESFTELRRIDGICPRPDTETFNRITLSSETNNVSHARRKDATIRASHSCGCADKKGILTRFAYAPRAFAFSI